MHDVIIVGAGIGGATAAYFVRQAGLRVLVIEKKKLPRYKPCGGGVPRAALELFPFSFAPVIECEVNSVRYSWRGQHEFSMAVPAHAVAMVMRERLDYYVLQQAQVDVVEGEQVVTIEEDRAGIRVQAKSGHEWRGRYLIGADGANSVVARAHGLRRNRVWGAALQAEVPRRGRLVDEFDREALFELGAVQAGYLWVFPKTAHLSVGIGTFRGPQRELRELFRTDMAQRGISVDGVPIRAHALPIYQRHELLHTRRSLLVGDAAGLVDPLLGEGVRHAIRSGWLAARAVLNDDLSGYSDAIHGQIGSHLLLGRVWAWAFYRYPWTSYRLGVRSPALHADFVRMLSGKLTYGAMLLRVARYVWGAINRHDAVG
jgi:geranylgeranyl reductase family protein